MNLSPNRLHRSLLAVTLLTILTTMLAGCAAREVTLSQAQMQMNEMLDSVRRGAEPEEIKDCLSTRAYDTVEIVDKTRLVFLARNGNAWVNELRTPCAGLRRNHTLVFNLRINSACSMDRVQGIDAAMTGMQGIGTGMGNVQNAQAMCVLGKFYRIPDYQVPAVNEVLGEL